MIRTFVRICRLIIMTDSLHIKLKLTFLNVCDILTIIPVEKTILYRGLFVEQYPTL